MKIYCLDPCKEDILIDNSCAACIGYFDGFHLGHRQLVNETVKYAKEHGLQSAAASASVASSCGRMFSLGISRIRRSISWTCSFEAPPLPVIAIFIFLGSYSVIGTSRANAAAIATP